MAASEVIQPSEFQNLVVQMDHFMGHIAEELHTTGTIHLTPSIPPEVISTFMGIMVEVLQGVADMMQAGRMAIQIDHVGQGDEAHDHYTLVMLQGN